MSGDRAPLTMTHGQFLIGAAALEGGLLGVAFLLGWLLDVRPTEHLTWSLRDFGLGILAAVPMLLILFALMLTPGRGIGEIREFLRDTLGPLLARCRMIDLILLAWIAGLCEEILFRGLIYGGLLHVDRGLAVLVSNLLFGLAHMVTPVYAFLAAMAGLYLTALMVVDPSPNLLVPITAHSVYDFFAFLVVVRDVQNRPPGDN